MREALVAAAPDLLPFLETCAPWARWRDVCFVHAGLVPGVDLPAFGTAWERVWRHGDFLWGPPFPAAPEWRHYREAGLERVVVGHKVVEAPTLEQGGRALMIDTGAGHDRPGTALTFVRLPEQGLDPVWAIRVPRRPGPDASRDGPPTWIADVQTSSGSR